MSGSKNPGDDALARSTGATVVDAAERSEPSKAPLRSPHRNDIQGLRAILMIQVLLFHAWGIGSPIGVDAFIMVSAYLMTSSFVRRSQAGHMPFFIERWGNTFKRLLPPLVITVLATLVGSALLLPQTRWREMAIEAFASLTYWENWRLADVATDYYANDQALASPFQHLWSMSMQGQVFLLWPLIMTICVLLARKMKLNIRHVVFAAFVALMVASLVWLLMFAPDDNSVYFDTRARIWEFAFGSAVAAWAPRGGFSGPFARWLAWLGLAVIVVFSLVPIGTYPGPMAFAPMAAVSAILLYRPPSQAPKFDVTRLLSIRPLTALGNTSYAVYLVHWPIFVFFLIAVGRPQLSLVEGVFLIAVSVLLASLLTTYIDDPLRNWPWSNSATNHKWAVVFVSLTIGFIPVIAFFLWINAVEHREEAAANVAETTLGEVPAFGPGSDAHPGARALVEDFAPNFVSPPIPGPLALADQWATFDGKCTDWLLDRIPTDRNSACTAYGNHLESDASVFIAGNSHAQQLLLPMVEPLLREKNWSAEAVLKGACTWGEAAKSEEACKAHNEILRDYVDILEPEYVFLIVTQTVVDSPKERLIPGVEELILDLTSQGITVVGLTDNLRSDRNLYACSDERDQFGIYGGCELPERQHFSSVSPANRMTGIPGFHLIDLRDLYCVDGSCPTIIGNIFVYMDKNHVSSSYSASMAPIFGDRVKDRIFSR